MKPPFGLPGIGGSLGQCAVCGKPFLAELLLGEGTFPFDVTGCSQTLHAHKDCVPVLKVCKNFTDLPEASPLRQAFKNATSLTEETTTQ